MNLLDNEDVKTRKKRTKSIMIAIIVLIILLIIACIILVMIQQNIQTNMLKLTLDGNSQLKFSNETFVIENNTVYVSIEDFAPLVGYNTYRGDHQSESNTKGYIQSSFEEASFELDSNQITKTIIGSNDSEYFQINDSVKMMNKKLYISAEGMQIAANCLINYNSKTNHYTVYSLSYLTTFYSTKNTDANMEDFSNQKAILQNMLVVKNVNGNVGVRTLEGKEIIGTKYDNIKFVESSNDFIVTTTDKKMGILSIDGSTKIQPKYDDIKEINKDLLLYLVKYNNKYGVINQNGNTIIYAEYDKIGIDSTIYKSNEIKNSYFIFDKYIPVQKEKKWGLYDSTGNKILELNYDELGCSTSQKGNSVLIIPKKEYLVVGQNKKYGIVNNKGKEILPCQLDSMYSIVNSGKTTYYMSQGNTEVEIISYIEKNGLDPNNNEENMNIVDNTDKSSTTSNQNVVTNGTNSANNNTMSSTNTNNVESVMVQSNTVMENSTQVNIISSQTNVIESSIGNVTP